MSVILAFALQILGIVFLVLPLMYIPIPLWASILLLFLMFQSNIIGAIIEFAVWPISLYFAWGQPTDTQLIIYYIAFTLWAIIKILAFISSSHDTN